MKIPFKKDFSIRDTFKQTGFFLQASYITRNVERNPLD
jgi:hypothetical protein